MLMSGGDINEIVRRLMYGDVEDDGGEEVNLLCVCWYERLWEELLDTSGTNTSTTISECLYS